jgi:O-antigen ligase
MTTAIEAVLVLHALVFSSSSVYRAAAALAGAAGLIFAVRRGVTNSSLRIFAPFAVGAIVSIAYGAAPGPSWEAAGVILGAFGWFLAGRREEGETESGGRIAALAALALAVGAVGEYIILHRQPRLWMTSPIDLGLALVVTGALGSGAISRTRARALFLAAVAAGCAATGSRGILFAAAIALLLLWPGSLRLRFLVVSMLALVALPIVLPRVTGDPLAWSRPRIWASAASLLEERPWTGWGLGSFETVSRRALLPDLLPVRRMRAPTHAHNDPLQLLADVGLPLGAATLAGFALCAIALARNGLRVRLAIVAAAGAVSLVYFPFQLAWPLYVACFAAGGAVGASPAERRSPAEWRAKGLRLPAAALLIYAVGIMIENPHLARWDGRLALKRLPDPSGVMRLVELEPARPEARANVAILAARHAASGGAIRAFERATGLAPFEMPTRFELVRAWRWHESLAADSSVAEAARRMADCHLAFIRAAEPLTYAAHAGDPVSARLVALELERLEREGFEANRIDLLWRPLDGSRRDTPAEPVAP